VSELLAGLVAWLAVTVVAGVVRLLLFAVRLVLWLFALAGFRGIRLVTLVATVAGVRWATPIVGVGPAVWLALVGWAAWAVRHHRTAIRQHAAVRRLAHVVDGYAAELAAAARRWQPPRPRQATPKPAPAPPGGSAPGLPPPLAFEPSPGLAKVARFVARRWGPPPTTRTNPAPHAALADRKES
jgi:hypothetical protein